MCVLIRDQKKKKKRIRYRTTWSRSPGTGRGRDWSDETTRPGTPRASEARKEGTRGNHTCSHLDFGLLCYRL